MQVEILTVDIPAAYSRRWNVPRYDLPILEELWPKNTLLPDAKIEVCPTGVIEDRDMDAEWERLQTQYRANIGSTPAYRRAYPSKDDFRLAFEAAEWHKPQPPVEVQVSIEVAKRMAEAGLPAEPPKAADDDDVPPNGEPCGLNDCCLPDLKDLVDDRSLPALAEIGITNSVELRESIVGGLGQELVDTVPFFTARALAKVSTALGIA